MEICPICSLGSTNSPIESGNDTVYSMKCPRCGCYKISFRVTALLQDKLKSAPLKIANISGYIRENSMKILEEKDVEYLLSIKTPTVAQKAEKLLLHLSKKYPGPGEYFGIPSENPAFLGISWAHNWAEVSFLVDQYLLAGKQFLHKLPNKLTASYNISPKGWAYIEGLKYANPESQIGFIAMWFDDSMNSLLADVIEPAITEAGYEPKRIDQHEHTNRIDDEIIAMLRRSKFVVADFTGQRGGVYFEAGYAKGLGLEVFWLCEKEEIEQQKIHFDTRQYNFIGWGKNNLPAAKKALQDRIESILGQGKYVKK